MAWVFLLSVDLLVGKVKISVSDLWGSLVQPAQHSASQLIIYNFRLPKAIAAILAGLSLGISGLLTQTYFRNPLAGPDVLGISSGASLGVAVVMLVVGQFFP
ncbi:MAG: iron chelate uptake ABC transporter family permease subunit, partial [Bacteroidales bacterium]